MKRITLSLLALFTVFALRAQSDCATAQSISVAANASTSVQVSSISGTPPSSICVNNYQASSVTAASWYSYTNSGSNALVVTVDVPLPQSQSGYYASFNIYTGSCGTLTCVGGSLVTQGNSGINQAEVAFLAEAGTTYYIVFDDFYSAGGLGGTSNFSFNVATTTEVPDVPGVATNPTPEDGATNVTIEEVQTQQGTVANAVDFAWTAPTSGGPVSEYVFLVSKDQSFPEQQTIQGSFTTTTLDNIFVPSMPDYFAYNTTYYWKVIPTNVGGQPETSNVSVWSFTTEEQAAVEDFDAVTFTHFQNNGMLSMEASKPMSEVVIFNLLGQQVSTKTFDNQTEASISLSDLARGMYIAKVKVEGQTKSFKFVK